MQQLITTAGQLGEILRRRRKARGVSQRELASKLGVGQARLSALEGNPERLTLGRLIALVNLLGLELVVQDKSDAAIPKTEW